MTMLKISTCQRQTTWAIYKRGQGFELGATIKQIQIEIRARLETRNTGLRVRGADHLATLPHPKTSSS